LGFQVAGILGCQNQAVIFEHEYEYRFAEYEYEARMYQSIPRRGFFRFLPARE
jgi:hypothetical protein